MKTSVLIYAVIMLAATAPVSAHSGGAAAGQHFIEHLLLALMVGVPAGYALLRLWSAAKPRAAD